MRRITLLLVLIVTAGVGSFGLTRWFAKPPIPTDALAWMATEFSLTPAQRTRIAALQADYMVVCDRHCAAIADAKSKLAEASPATRAQAEADMQRLEVICIDSTRAHLRAIAAQMEPVAGRRFLALVEPKLAGFRHEAPLGLP